MPPLRLKNIQIELRAYWYWQCCGYHLAGWNFIFLIPTFSEMWKGGNIGGGGWQNWGQKEAYLQEGLTFEWEINVFAS